MAVDVGFPATLIHALRSATVGLHRSRIIRVGFPSVFAYTPTWLSQTSLLPVSSCETHTQLGFCANFDTNQLFPEPGHPTRIKNVGLTEASPSQRTCPGRFESSLISSVILICLPILEYKSDTYFVINRSCLSVSMLPGRMERNNWMASEAF